MLQAWAIIALFTMSAAQAGAEVTPSLVTAAPAHASSHPAVSGEVSEGSEKGAPTPNISPASAPSSSMPTSGGIERSSSTAVAASPTREHQPSELTVHSANSSGREPPAADVYARAIGVLGLSIAVINFLFTLYKMLRDRHFSIEDDFWFRKIISPSTIEPLIKAISEILESVPTIESSADDKKAFAVKVTTKFQGLSSNMEALALLYPDLPVKIVAKLRACEDVLTEYAAEISNDNLSKAGVNIESLRIDVWRCLSIALSTVREEQMRHTFSIRQLIWSNVCRFLKR